MRPTIYSATILAAATSLAAGDNDHHLTSKSSKSSCSSSSPKLEKFCYEEPANFEGAYKECYSNVLREAATGPTGVFHFCPNGEREDFGTVFKKLDEYGAYEASLEAILPGIDAAMWKFQGIAQGNSITMTTFGGGVLNGDGDILLPSDTPDTQECTLYDDGIIKCMNYFEEYCGQNAIVLPSDCEVGEWLMSYTIETVYALEGFECPPAPVGFCESNVPTGPGRKLQEEEEEASHPCPFLNKKMN